LIDVRKEKCIGKGLGPILAPHPQMVTPDEALPARANIRIPKIISQFYGLVHPTVTVSQVGRLRCSQMGPKAFDSTGRLVIRIYDKTNVTDICSSTKTHNPIAFAKCRKPPSARTHSELRPEMITCISVVLSKIARRGEAGGM
jgi:hypothetical protein